MGAGTVIRTRWGAGLACGLALLAATGCTTLRAERPRHREAATSQTADASRDAAIEVSRRFLTAYRDGRHAALQRELSEPLRASFGGTRTGRPSGSCRRRWGSWSRSAS